MLDVPCTSAESTTWEGKWHLTTQPCPTQLSFSLNFFGTGTAMTSRTTFLHNVSNSVEKVSLNLDARSVDRLRWTRHACKTLLDVEAGPAVVLRCALDHYTRHLESLLAKPDAEGIDRERLLLSVAKRGVTASLPAEELLALPLKPFSQVEADDFTARMEEGRAKVSAMLSRTLDG
jgi:hypothetical protein